MPTMIIMMGIPGSGKSTFCKSKLSQYVRINLDTLHTRNKEQLMLTESMTAQKDIVIDNTNPTKEERNRYIKQAKENQYKIVGYFMKCDFNDCMERNSQREGKEKLPYKALASIAKKMELPEYSEGFDELFYVNIIDNKFIVDKWRA